MAISNKLVIVESPAKAGTISKYLGKGYKVEASQGHIRDLPKSQLGVDVDDDFEMKYITIHGRGKILSKIRKEAKNASTVYLATDPDREGEAISWHLAQTLGIDPESACRIEFHEVTPKAVKAALQNPRKINMDLVDSQQARRALDRLVGYKISPLLWAKVKKGTVRGPRAVCGYPHGGGAREGDRGLHSPMSSGMLMSWRLCPCPAAARPASGCVLRPLTAKRPN